MELVRTFGEISKEDVSRAGGKGASLGEMTRAKMPVPPGFVILSSAFEQFLEETGLNVEIEAILHTIKTKKIHTEYASKKIKSLILGAQMPGSVAKQINSGFKALNAEYVAVRSSATAEDSVAAAWAGQLDSFLNTRKKDLLKNVQKCWASLFTPRAIFYRSEKGLKSQKVSVAVVVQKMVKSEMAGVAFSVHPVTEDKNQLIIEAAFGLGDKVVSGEITPDEYVVAKDSRRILDMNINMKQQVLAKDAILELSELVLNIEAHYGFPCDIEWAFEKGKFYITQSRPITTLSVPRSAKEGVTTKDIIGNMRLELWLERKGMSPLLTSMFQLLEGTPLKKLIGGGYQKQVCVMKNGIAYWLRPTADLAELPDLHRKFVVQTSIEELRALLEQAMQVYESTDANIKAIERGDDIQFSRDIKNLLRELSDILLYTTSIPYYLLSALEHGEVKEEKRKLIQGMCEKLRGDSKYVRAQSVFMSKLAPFLKTRYQFSVKEAENITYDELAALLSSKKWKKDKEMLARSDLSVFWLNSKADKHIFAYEPEIVNRLLNTYVSVKPEYGREVRGSVACTGFAKGRVAMVNSLEQISKVRKGDVIVSRSTNPSLMPALIKCAAIVTDEGGIGSHAAIVSRELKKPCIIGTKIATRVFKDGDFVEVDANNGIVRLSK